MKHFHFPLICFSVFFFCFIQSNAQLSVVKIDSAFDVPFFHSPKMLFPSEVLKRGKGKYLNVITGKRIHSKDTLQLKKIASSQVVRYDSLPDRMFPDSISSLSSHAQMRGDTLFLHYAFEPPPQSDELEIILSSKLLARIREYPIGNLESRSPSVLLKSIKLNKRAYAPGDQIKAELEFSIEFEFNDVARGPYRQRVYYKGWMMCKVD
jgi:hypothetical protein